MTPHTAASDEQPQWQWPLRFSEHDFLSVCYDTYGCNVRYAGIPQQFDAPDVLSPSPASHGINYQENWPNGQAGIRNFPGPAEVSWRSRDGVPHTAHIDIASIFADQSVRHHVARDEIPRWATIHPPTIVLEVKDRAINVYMRSHIPTKQEQIPGNRYSNFRREVVLVKSYNY